MNPVIKHDVLTLCIAIPTFNRAFRLDKALNDLREHIIRCKEKNRITVYVSNNGSTDNTANVLGKYSKLFNDNSIPYSFDNLSVNGGFDANVLNCYFKASGNYVWFLADDDNLEPGSIEAILKDIDHYAPNVMYYNFSQKPNTYENPYVMNYNYIEKITEQDVWAIPKIINNPKLSSMIMRRDNLNIGYKVNRVCGVEVSRSYGYIHCALVIQAAFECGKVLLSSKFIAFPDPDYMDHVDFPPYVGVELKEIVNILLELNLKQHFKQEFSFHLANRLTTSMNTLATFYRGKIVLTPELKEELWNTVNEEFTIKGIFNHDFLIHLLRLSIAIIYSIIFYIIKGAPVTKLKDRSKSYIH